MRDARSTMPPMVCPLRVVGDPGEVVLLLAFVEAAGLRHEGPSEVRVRRDLCREVDGLLRRCGDGDEGGDNKLHGGGGNVERGTVYNSARRWTLKNEEEGWELGGRPATGGFSHSFGLAKRQKRPSLSRFAPLFYRGIFPRSTESEPSPARGGWRKERRVYV